MKGDTNYINLKQAVSLNCIFMLKFCLNHTESRIKLHFFFLNFEAQTIKLQWKIQEAFIFFLLLFRSCACLKCCRGWKI